jgi:hypothetical protein
MLVLASAEAAEDRAGNRALVVPVGLAAVESAVAGFCDGFDPGVGTAAVAAEAVRRLAVVKRRIEAAEAHAARRVDTSLVWRHAGYRNAAEWMAANTGDPVGMTAGLLDTARKLESCPVTAEAFAAGEVSVPEANTARAARAPLPRHPGVRRTPIRRGA